METPVVVAVAVVAAVIGGAYLAPWAARCGHPRA